MALLKSAATFAVIVFVESSHSLSVSGRALIKDLVIPLCWKKKAAESFNAVISQNHRRCYLFRTSQCRWLFTRVLQVVKMQLLSNAITSKSRLNSWGWHMKATYCYSLNNWKWQSCPSCLLMQVMCSHPFTVMLLLCSIYWEHLNNLMWQSRSGDIIHSAKVISDKTLWAEGLGPSAEKSQSRRKYNMCSMSSHFIFFCAVVSMLSVLDCLMVFS